MRFTFVVVVVVVLFDSTLCDVFSFSTRLDVSSSSSFVVVVFVVVAVTRKSLLPSCYRAFWASPNGGHTSCVFTFVVVVVVVDLFDSTLCDVFSFSTRLDVSSSSSLVVVVFVVVAITKNTCYPRVTARLGRPLTAVTRLASLPCRTLRHGLKAQDTCL